MEHVVFYPSTDGTPAFRRVSCVEEAVNFVEHLRNTEGTTEFSVHALTEVPLTVRAYYRIEPDVSGSHNTGPDLSGSHHTVLPSQAAAEAAEPLAATATAPVAEAPLGDSQEVVPIPGGRRSMGFFARS